MYSFFDYRRLIHLIYDATFLIYCLSPFAKSIFNRSRVKPLNRPEYWIDQPWTQKLKVVRKSSPWRCRKSRCFLVLLDTARMLQCCLVLCIWGKFSWPESSCRGNWSKTYARNGAATRWHAHPSILRTLRRQKSRTFGLPFRHHCNTAQSWSTYSLSEDRRNTSVVGKDWDLASWIHGRYSDQAAGPAALVSRLVLWTGGQLKKR